MLKWTNKDKTKVITNSNPIIVPESNLRILSGISSSDIKTHIVNQSISAWKSGDRIFVWQLSQITDIQKITNRLIILTDDNDPTTLYFTSVNECELASQKFTDAGNGQVV
jgi:Fe-S-cluster formation regulator IscX/YfhJ